MGISNGHASVLKKVMSCMLAVILASGLLPAQQRQAFADDDNASMAGVVESGDYSYEFVDEDDGGVRIVDYRGDSSEVFIPKTIDGHDVVDVSGTGWLDKATAFRVEEGNLHLYEIDGVLFEKDYQPSFPTNLRADDALVLYPGGRLDEEYTVPEGTEGIAMGAFSKCRNLKKMVVSEGVAFIEQNAFETGNENAPFEEIYLPSTLESFLHHGNTHKKSNLRILKVADGNPYFSNDEQGLLYDDSTQTLRFVPRNTLFQSIDIREGTKAVETGAFEYVQCAGPVVIPDGVTEIKYWAFAPFYGSDIYVPATVSSFGSGCFGMEGLFFDGTVHVATQEQYDLLKDNQEYISPLTEVVLGDWESGDDGDALAADAPLAQLAACELTDFNAGSFMAGDTVSGFLGSSYFMNKVIWGSNGNTYEDFFSKTLGGYKVLASTLNAHYGTPYIVLEDPDSGDVILAFKTTGPEGLGEQSMAEFFDSAAEIYVNVQEAYPDAEIYLTGAGIGGQAVAYLSTALDIEATTFNAAPDYASRMAYVSQAPMMTGNEFRGVDYAGCLHYYSSSLEGQGYGADHLATVSVDENPSADPEDLSALYRAAGDSYEMCGCTPHIPPAVLQTMTTLDAEDTFWSMTEAFAEFALTRKFDFSSFTSLFGNGGGFTKLTLGTTGRDISEIGLDNAGDYVIHQVGYTGEAHADVFYGGQTSDVFVAGEGGSAFSGGPGSDLYIIGDGARVNISDVWSMDNNVFCEGAFGALRLVGLGDGLASIDVAQAAVNLLFNSKQDTVIFRNCSFDDMEIELQDEWFGTDYFNITAGDSFVQIPRRTFIKKDFLIIAEGDGGKAESIDLKELYERKHPGARASEAAALADNGEEDYSDVVTFGMSGEGVKVRVVDAATGDVLAELSSDDEGASDAVSGNNVKDLCLDSGTFTVNKAAQRIDGAYDASKLRVEALGGKGVSVVTNRTTDDAEGDIAYAESVSVDDYEKVEIRADGDVTLVGVTGSGEEAIDTEIVESPYDNENDNPDQPSDPGTDDPSPSDPSNPSAPTDHAVSVTYEGSLGSVEVSDDSAAKGGKVTVTAIPFFGYEVGSVTVTAGGKDVEATAAGDGAWTFEMPDGDVSVSVEFVPTAWDNPFADVGEDDWFYDAIRRANLAGLMNGYDGVGLFGPDDGLKREQAATVMWNLMGRDDTTRPAATHSDVVQGEWYAPQVNWAVDAKVMDGYDAGTFGVGDELTREQFAAVIAKAVGADVDAADATVLSSFPDSGEASEWARQTLAWAVENGVINGAETESGRELQPTRTLTRAEMATMMMNAIDKGVLELALG